MYNVHFPTVISHACAPLEKIEGPSATRSVLLRCISGPCVDYDELVAFGIPIFES